MQHSNIYTRMIIINNNLGKKQESDYIKKEIGESTNG